MEKQPRNTRSKLFLRLRFEGVTEQNPDSLMECQKHMSIRLWTKLLPVGGLAPPPDAEEMPRGSLWKLQPPAAKKMIPSFLPSATPLWESALNPQNGIENGTKADTDTPSWKLAFPPHDTPWRNLSLHPEPSERLLALSTVREEGTAGACWVHEPFAGTEGVPTRFAGSRSR